jgi:xylose isomerase
LKEKAARFEADPEIKAALAVARVPDLATPTKVGDGSAEALRSYVKTLDENALGRAHYGHEQLDQLVTELLLGVR